MYFICRQEEVWRAKIDEMDNALPGSGYGGLLPGLTNYGEGSLLRSMGNNMVVGRLLNPQKLLGAVCG